MFQWDKSINDINVPASKVMHLFRSMREVQLALPGVSAQQASAFLCQYQVEGGIATVAVFHLHKSKVLSFYFSDPRVVPEQKTDSMLDQGLNFVESMGFLMTDQDIHLLDEADQEMLWASLPMKAGLSEEQEPPPAEVPVSKAKEKPVANIEAVSDKAASLKAAPVEKKEASAAVAGIKAVKKVAPVVAPVEVAPKAEAETETTENVDDLLAAVEAMRAKRPGLRERKSAPSAEEMDRRRLQLRETVGRILASL
ncbi:MAG: hypothetical protein KAU27_04310 [Desulfuromonadales bacterium]|nr:hypothetical protein [Desulfuromonadales bacterium]